MKAVAPIAILLMLGFSSFYFLPPAIGKVQPDAVTTTTNQALAPMTSPQTFNTFASCFQNQCSGTIKYVFKPSGFVYWHNVGSGNITLTGFTVGGVSRSVTASSNSTTIDYHIAVPNVVTMDVYFKETPTNGHPSNTFKVTMIGTSSVSGTFTWNFGNPQAFPVTCDNTKHLLTYGVTGINFTDATNFSATCTTTSVSFTIGIGAFRIDPTTIGTSTASNALSLGYQGREWFASTRYWIFYWNGASWAWRSSTNGLTWSSETTVTISDTSSRRRVSFYNSGTTIYYASGKASGAETKFYYRYGSLNTDGTITWTISETSVTTTGNTIDFVKTAVDSNGNIWVSVSTLQSAIQHMEVWEGTSCSSLCSWASSLDLTNQIQGNLIPITSGKMGLLYNDGGTTLMKAVFFSGSTWGTAASATNVPTALDMNNEGMSTSIGDTLEIAAQASNICKYASIAYSTTPSWSTVTIGGSGTRTCAIASDNSNILVYYITLPAANEADYYISTNSGSTWSAVKVIATGQTNVNQIVNSPSITNNISILGWLTGTASPFNIVFQIVTTNTPLLIQSTSCTFTGSSGTCAFGSNTAANDNVVVIIGDIVSTTVSTVTDSQSLTYTLLVSKDAGTIGDIEGWCAAPTGAAADTITVTYGVSVTATIILYELSTPRCDPLTSTGTGTAVTSASVSSFTPTANAFVIGSVDSTCQVACTVSAGSGYSLDKTVNTGAANTVDTEYFWNVAIADTAPFTFSAASSYNEVSMAFTRSVAVSPSSSFSAVATFKQGVGKNPSSSFTLSPVFSPQLVLSRAFSAAFSASAKFNQGLNLHPFLPTFTLSPFFDFFRGLTPPPVLLVPQPDYTAYFAMAIMFIFVVLILIKKRR